jgi:hypothetical protein
MNQDKHITDGRNGQGPHRAGSEPLEWVRCTPQAPCRHCGGSRERCETSECGRFGVCYKVNDGSTREKQAKDGSPYYAYDYGVAKASPPQGSNDADAAAPRAATQPRAARRASGTRAPSTRRAAARTAKSGSSSCGVSATPSRFPARPTARMDGPRGRAETEGDRSTHPNTLPPAINPHVISDSSRL